jgi:hypothetical protein
VVRATKFILASFVLIFSAFPALALYPIGQKQATPPRTAPPSPPPAHSYSNPPNTSPGATGNYQFHPQGPGPHRGDWLRKYMALPPNQQEQQLQHDPSFRSLPPEKQNHLMDRLRNFNSQPPEKKAKILDRMETFEHMTPAQQNQARNLFQRYHGLPNDEQNKVSQGYRRLRGMPPSARNEYMNSDEFKNNYSPEERDLLKGMSDLNLGPTR